jgi:hypothetical protein
MDCILCDGHGHNRHGEKCALCLGSCKQPSVHEVQGRIAEAIEHLPRGIRIREQMKQLSLQVFDGSASG